MYEITEPTSDQYGSKLAGTNSVIPVSIYYSEGDANYGIVFSKNDTSGGDHLIYNSTEIEATSAADCVQKIFGSQLAAKVVIISQRESDDYRQSYHDVSYWWDPALPNHSGVVPE